MRALIVSLMVMALLHAFTPYITGAKAAVSNEAVETLAGQARLISPDNITGYLRQTGHPTMLVVYASWCTYCKKLMPSLYALWGEGKISGDNLLIISRDESLSDVSRYLLEARLDGMVGVPLVLKSASKTELAAALRPLGSGYNGGIPYIGYFDKNGVLVDEIFGSVGKGELESSLGSLQ